LAIELKVRSDSRQAQQDLSKLNKSVENIDRTTKRSAQSIKRLAIGTAAAFAAIGTGSAITGITDSYRRLEARIALTNKSLFDQEYAFRQINKIAIETRGSQESLADLYSRIGRATARLGVEQETVIDVTRSIAKAITISGSSAESANAAIVQLGQGLAAGALRGQELNSVMEQTPAVAQAIARGMGITIGQLRQFAQEGKLNAEAVINALKNQGSAIDEEFQRVPVTFAQAATVFSTGFGRIINEFDQVVGLSTSVTRKLQNVGISLNKIARPMAISFENSLQSVGEFLNALSPVANSVSALGASFVYLGKSISEGLSLNQEFTLVESLQNRMRSIGQTLRTVIPSFESIAISIQRIANGVVFFSKKINNALEPIADFAGKVKKYFYDLYIAVVGNSYWPDLVKGVIDWSYKLKDALKPISDFAEAVANRFSELSTEVKIALKAMLALVAPLTATLLTLQSVFTKKLEVNLPTAEDFKALGESIKTAIVNASDSIKRGLLLVMGAAITAVLGFSSIAFLGLAVIIAEQFREGTERALGTFETDLNTVFKNAGKITGEFLVAFVASLPEIAKIVGGFVVGVVQGFLSGIPVIGPIIANIIAGIDTITNKTLSGLAGIGVFSFLVFGKKGLAFFGKEILAGTVFVAKWAGSLISSTKPVIAIMAALRNAYFVTSVFLTTSFSTAYASVIFASKAFVASTIATLSGLMTAIGIRLAAVGTVLAGGLGATFTALAVSVKAAVATAFTALTALLAHPIFLTIAAVVAGVSAIGAVGVYLFGEGDSFGEKVDNVKKDIKGLFDDADDEMNAEVKVATVTTPSDEIVYSANMSAQEYIDAFNVKITDSGIDTGILSLEEMKQESAQAIASIQSKFDSIDISNGFETSVKKVKGSFTKIKGFLSDLNIEADDDTFIGLRASTAAKITKASEKLAELKDKLSKATEITLEQEQDIKRQVQEIRDNASKQLSIEKELVDTVREFGFSKREILRMSDEELQKYRDILKARREAEKPAKRIDVSKSFESLQDAGFSGTFTQLKSLADPIQETMSSLADTIATISAQPIITEEEMLKMEAAAQSFSRINEKLEEGRALSQGFRDSLQTTFSDVLKGTSSVKDAFIGFLEDLASKIIDSGVNNFLDSIMGKAGDGFGLDDAFGSAVTGVPSSTKGEGEGLTELPAKGLEKLTGSVAQADAGILGWLGSVGSSIASALGFGTATAVASGTTATAATTTLGFTTALSLATGALMQLASAAMTASMTSGFSFFSTGGYVSGAGTGTSDSIPAMLSNGEYVINAKATKRHGALIKAINDGSDIGRFSTGGQVGNNLPVMSMESQTKRMSGVAPSQKGSTTVNLQVTGDVTEATRKAVRDMGNELSQQVEGNFRERGVLNG